MKSTFLVCCSLLAFGGAIAIAPNLNATSLAKQQNQTSPIRSTNISQSTNRVSFETELLKLTNLERQKVGLSPLKLSGENIAAGKSTPEEAIRQWMNSSGHRANILNSRFTEIGFGYENAPNSRYRHYWVQVFGTPQR